MERVGAWLVSVWTGLSGCCAKQTEDGEAGDPLEALAGPGSGGRACTAAAAGGEGSEPSYFEGRANGIHGDWAERDIKDDAKTA